ncbi:MAG: hypothetical protein ACH255_21245, partial [Candidatus Thiodiazotropha sp.]
EYLNAPQHNFCPFSTANGHVPRMPQSFITSQTKELFKRYQYILKYFIILYDQNGPGIDEPSKVSWLWHKSV